MKSSGKRSCQNSGGEGEDGEGQGAVILKFLSVASVMIGRETRYHKFSERENYFIKVYNNWWQLGNNEVLRENSDRGDGGTRSTGKEEGQCG